MALAAAPTQYRCAHDDGCRCLAPAVAAAPACHLEGRPKAAVRQMPGHPAAPCGGHRMWAVVPRGRRGPAGGPGPCLDKAASPRPGPASSAGRHGHQRDRTAPYQHRCTARWIRKGMALSRKAPRWCPIMAAALQWTAEAAVARSRRSNPSGRQSRGRRKAASLAGGLRQVAAAALEALRGFRRVGLAADSQQAPAPAAQPHLSEVASLAGPAAVGAPRPFGHQSPSTQPRAPGHPQASRDRGADRAGQRHHMRPPCSRCAGRAARGCCE
mmetsp:Transcript_144481/g.360135  ORF Transcript_144481/g.360135 Transcript_144481/m.360135 type:complete len:270 (-) Transcript_144481:1078-1887(-)